MRGIAWYWPVPGGARKVRYCVVLACPGWGLEGAVLRGIAWYWPVPRGGRGGIARYCVVLAFSGWEPGRSAIRRHFLVLAFPAWSIGRRGISGRRELGGEEDWSPDPKPSSQDLIPCTAAKKSPGACAACKTPTTSMPKAQRRELKLEKQLAVSLKLPGVRAHLAAASPNNSGRCRSHLPHDSSDGPGCGKGR